MLSSRQNHSKGPRAMPPEPMGFLRKVRKTLAGRPFHSQSADYPRLRAKSMSFIPQLDSEGSEGAAAMPVHYVRKTSLTANTYPGSCLSVAPAHVAPPSRAVEDGRGQAGLANGSAWANGALPNGSHGCADEPQVTDEPPDVSKVFEQQGARPKVPRRSWEETDHHPLGVSASPSVSCSEDASANPDPDPESLPDLRPASTPCHSDVAQPCLPPAEANCVTCALSPPAAPVQEGSTSGLSKALGSVSLVAPPRRVHNAPKPSPGKTTTKARQQPMESWAPCPLYTSCTPLPDENTPPGAHSGSQVSISESEPPAADQNFYSPVDAGESDTVGAGQRAVPSNGCKTHSAAADRCRGDGEVEGRKNSLNLRVADETMEIESIEPPREAPVEDTATQVDEATTCPPEWSQEVHRHCCTCTCGRSSSRPGLGAGAPSRSSLTLEGIPPDDSSCLEGSPQPPRTPHIAMLVDGDRLFINADGNVEPRCMSAQELDMMLQFSDEASSSEEEGRPTGREGLSSETSEVLGRGRVAPVLERVHAQGASGGDSSAPVVDRSSKPRDLCEAVCKGEEAEEEWAAGEDPPPLPPRVPCRSPPNSLLRDTFSSYPILDNRDDDEDDEDDFVTHEFLHNVHMDLYTEPTEPTEGVKSKSLPRSGVTSDLPPASPPELRLQPGAKRGKTVNMRNRFSQIFKPVGRKKRHSSHGFPDRPLPDIPPHPRLARSMEPPQQSHPPVFRMASCDNVSQQAVTEDLPKEKACKAEKTREQFAISLRKISEYGWYWGPMSWDDAESRLENMPDGSFLVRDSSNDRHLLSLSFRAQGSTHHTRVEHHNGKFSFWSQPCSHGSASIVEFVEEAMRHSHSGRILYFLRPRMQGYPPAAVQLLYPISRFQKARSLQHMCRFVIRRHVRLDHIDALPLPGRLRKYLKEAQYYTPEDILH